VNDEFGFARLRDCLGDLLGVFPRGVMAELVPGVAAHHQSSKLSSGAT
jgi:hypothetical protein